MYSRNLNSDLQCMCFSEKLSFVSGMHQEHQQHKTFLIQATEAMPSVLDALTGLSYLLLDLNFAEKRQIKNNLSLARSETVDSRRCILPLCSHT